MGAGPLPRVQVVTQVEHEAFRSIAPRSGNPTFFNLLTALGQKWQQSYGKRDRVANQRTVYLVRYIEVDRVSGLDAKLFAGLGRGLLC